MCGRVEEAAGHDRGLILVAQQCAETSSVAAAPAREDDRAMFMRCACEIVARGEAEIGFQQISELVPVAGIDLVGPLPPEVQRVTVFAAGVGAAAANPALAKRFIEFLASPAAADVIRKTALEPVAAAPPVGNHAALPRRPGLKRSPNRRRATLSGSPQARLKASPCRLPTQHPKEQDCPHGD